MSIFPLRGYPADTPLDRDIYSTFDSRLIAYCAEEVRRQGDTPWHVYRMMDAWEFAFEHAGSVVYGNFVPFTPSIIRELGKKVDEANQFGFREHAIYIMEGWTGITKPIGEHWLGVEAAVQELCDNQNDMDAITVYAEFERIHPFADGNGRVGKILYNWKNETLADPVWPVDLYGGVENP